MQSQDRALAVRDFIGRKALNTEWVAQDQLTVVRARLAENYMNTAAAWVDRLKELKFLRNGCGLDLLCYIGFDSRITTAINNMNNNINAGEIAMTQLGQLAELRMTSYGGRLLKSTNAATLKPSNLVLKKQWIDNSIIVGG